MNPFQVIPSSLLCGMLALLVACGPAQEPADLEQAQTPPANVVLVSIDTLRADHLSAYGYHRQTTPSLDALASESALFENAYVHVPFTLKSHMSLLTSLFPAAHGVTSDTSLSEAAPSLPRELDAAGYYNAGFYTLRWLDPEYGFERGFDDYRFMDSGGSVRDAALELIPELAARRPEPFFLFLHVREPHCGPGMKKPGNPLYNSAPAEFRDAFLPHPDLKTKHRPRDIWDNKVEVSDEELANIVATYDGSILYADALIGDVLASLTEHGLHEETMIVVTSDHGESLGARNDFRSHGGFWEEGLKVPLIIKLPQAHALSDTWRGTRIDDRVQSVDVAPTILGALGMPIPEMFQGQNLLEPQDRDVIADQGTRNVSALIRDNYKLRVFRREGKTKMRLYDLTADPDEEHSLHMEKPELTVELKTALQAHLRDHRQIFESLAANAESSAVELDDAKQDQLRALGYL